MHRVNRESEERCSGAPHLAKNQRDVGHPAFVRELVTAGLKVNVLPQAEPGSGSETALAAGLRPPGRLRLPLRFLRRSACGLGVSWMLPAAHEICPAD